MNKQEARKIALSRAADILRAEAQNGEGLLGEAEQNGSDNPEADAEKIAQALQQIADSLEKRIRGELTLILQY